MGVGSSSPELWDYNKCSLVDLNDVFKLHPIFISSHLVFYNYRLANIIHSPICPLHISLYQSKVNLVLPVHPFRPLPKISLKTMPCLIVSLTLTLATSCGFSLTLTDALVAGRGPFSIEADVTVVSSSQDELFVALGVPHSFVLPEGAYHGTTSPNRAQSAVEAVYWSSNPLTRA